MRALIIPIVACFALSTAAPAHAGKGELREALNLAKEAKEINAKLKSACQSDLKGELNALVKSLKKAKRKGTAKFVKRALKKVQSAADVVDDDCPSKVGKKVGERLEEIEELLDDELGGGGGEPAQRQPTPEENKENAKNAVGFFGAMQNTALDGFERAKKIGESDSSPAPRREEKPKGPRAMSDRQFRDLLQALKDTNMVDRLEVLGSLMRPHHATVDQAGRIIKVMNMVDRLEALDTIVCKIVDRQNGSRILKNFNMVDRTEASQKMNQGCG